MPRKLWVSCAVMVLAGHPALAAGGGKKGATLATPDSSAAWEGVVQDTATGMELVLVKGGCFQMGNTFDAGGPEEKPAHEVCVDDFLIGRREVTQGQWKKIMGTNPSINLACGPSCPVEQVSWNDVQAFIGKLNRAGAGKKPSGKYRLPTEAEWEFAARSGGKKEKFSGGEDVAAVAWYFATADAGTHPVGLKAPNGLGLYDMTGNVWEWTGDWYAASYYASSPRKNPTGPSKGDRRVVRGGGFGNEAFDVRASYRNHLPPDHRAAGLGFRLVRSAPAQGK
jgi:formylglycine-generating enzyme required for sulfatase activity